jgi:hypothetical protein
MGEPFGLTRHAGRVGWPLELATSIEEAEGAPAGFWNS